MWKADINTRSTKHNVRVRTYVYIYIYVCVCFIYVLPYQKCTICIYVCNFTFQKKLIFRYFIEKVFINILFLL